MRVWTIARDPTGKPCPRFVDAVMLRPLMTPEVRMADSVMASAQIHLFKTGVRDNAPRRDN